MTGRPPYTMYTVCICCSALFVAKNARFAKKVFLSLNHKKPIRMCHEFQFYLSRADNTHFLVFNAARHSHSLIALQKQLEMRCKTERQWTGKEALQGLKVQKEENKLFLL